MSPVMIAALLLGLRSGSIAAQHEVTSGDDRIVVQTRWSSAAVARGTGTVDLAVPLPADAIVEGATADFGDDGRVVGLVLDDATARVPTVRVSVGWSSAVAAGSLPLPVAAASEIQRVTLDDTLTFRPDPALELAVSLGHTLPIGMGSHERHQVDGALGLHRPRLGAVYVTTAAIERTGGVRGSIEARAVGRRRTAFAVGGVFVVLCGAAAVAYRRLRHGAEAEQADLLLAAEFDALRRSDDGAGSAPTVKA